LLKLCVIKSFIKKGLRRFHELCGPPLQIVSWGSVVGIVTSLQVLQPRIHSLIPETARDMFFLEVLPTLALGPA
jgi:hypothetical protein